jgi:DNA repair exonuclease SbcCD ATPase subunit
MEAQVLIQQTALEIQVSVVFRINEIVNKTLAAVFPTYSFELVYEIKRNKSEASLKFFSGENEIKIMEDSGGACNLATTALRLAVWSLSKSANVLILDESLSNLSVDLHARAGEVLVELCRALNLQIILVSHSAIINEKADKLVMVTKDAHDVSAV